MHIGKTTDQKPGGHKLEIDKQISPAASRTSSKEKDPGQNKSNKKSTNYATNSRKDPVPLGPGTKRGQNQKTAKERRREKGGSRWRLANPLRAGWTKKRPGPADKA